MQLFGLTLPLGKRTAAPDRYAGRLSDPDNVDSEIAPGDYRDFTPAEQTDHEEAEVELVLERYRDASLHRRSVEREWVLSCAMVEGRQWLAWDDATHRAISLIDEEEPDRYVTHPLIRPLIAKVIALATMTKPDAICAPGSDSDLDRAAAAEGRVITAHLSRLAGGTIQTQEIATWAAVCGVGYVKHYWDPNARAEMPRFDSLGQIVGKARAPIGEEREEVLGPFEVFIDPAARKWRDAAWLIHASVKPLSWFVDRYGKIGEAVDADQADAYGGYVESYLSDGYGGVSQLHDLFGTGAARKAALCLEMWEKPTPRYPQGRLIVVADRRRMYSGPWPLESEEFPFSRLVYQEGIGHAYGQGLVKDLAPLQIALNRTLSRIVERVEQDKLTVMIPRGSGLGADAFETDEGRNLRKLYVDLADAGAPPAFFPPPPLAPDNWRLIDLIWLHMQHIAGIHEVNNGGTPPGVTAGISIELLQQGDRTQLGLFTSNIEQFTVRRDELRIALYSQYASGLLPRLMGLDDSGDPRLAQSRALAFRALTAGGSCKVIVVPGSATPKTPAGQQQEVLDYLKAGLFGPPGSPQAAYIAVRLLSLARSDEVLDLLRQQIEQQQQQAQQTPPPPGIQ